MIQTGWAVRDGQALGVGTRLVVTAGERLEAAAAAMDGVLAEVDGTYSRFRPDSELTRLHERRGSLQRVSPLLARALAAALWAARLTDGAVDPTVGRAIRVAGYDRRFDHLATSGPVLRLRLAPVPGWHLVELDELSRTVRFPEGVELDLGSTGKGLAADLAAAAAYEAAEQMGGVLVNLGGDIALAGEPPASGWVIAVAEDSSATAAGEAVSLLSGGVATSSTTVRRWRRGEVVLHHIIDPATGLPAGGPWRTVSVVAASCLDANIAATGAIVKGEAAVAWLTPSGLPARLVALDGTVIRIGGWPSSGGLTADTLPPR